MRIFNVEGFEIKESWMQNTNYPEPPDTHPSDLSVDNVKMWDRYIQEVEKIYNKCKLECTCKELEKNHEMCRICDEQDYNKFHDKMSGVFANVRNEFTSKVERSELFKVIHSNVNLLQLAKSDGDSYDKISISVKIEEDVLRHFKDKRL